VRSEAGCHAGFVVAAIRIGKANCGEQPVFRLHEISETSLDRRIAIAEPADQSRWAKLGRNAANEFPKSGKLGNMQGHREDLMPRCEAKA
jgi:hypothetical protein